MTPSQVKTIFVAQFKLCRMPPDYAGISNLYDSVRTVAGQNTADNKSQLPVRYVPLKMSPRCQITFTKKCDSVNSETGSNPEVNRNDS